MDSTALIRYLNDYLHITEIPDYGPQGLQVEAARSEIRRIALAVDSAPAVIEAAAAWEADMLLVHHGIFWGETQPIAGPLGKRVRLLLDNQLHLYAAHLALDAHSEVGNNAELARLLGITVAGWWCEVKGTPIGVWGERQCDLKEFVSQIETQLHTQVRLLAHGPTSVARVAILSGFGADRVAEAQALGVDTFITGETSHANYWAAADYGLNVLFAGHYATETVGVQALGQHLSDQFGVQTRFFDFPTAM